MKKLLFKIILPHQNGMRKDLKTFLIGALFVLVAISANAYDGATGGFYFNILSEKDRTCKIVGESGFESDSRGFKYIPETATYDGKKYTVVEIAERAFWKDRKLEYVDIPKSVKKIGDYAFQSCPNLKGVNAHGAEEIGVGAFNDSRYLTSVYMPVVKKMGKAAFCACLRLEVAIIPEGVEQIEDNTFYQCWSLRSVELPNSLLRIEDGAFGRCSITSINLPTSLVSIGNYAFSGCGLKELSIPASVTSIGEYAFSGCHSLQNVQLPPSLEKISKKMFSECDKLGEIDIPNSVTLIDSCAFNGCSALESVVMPNTVKEVSGNAFEGCSLLKNVELSSSLSSIDGGVFKDCIALESITMPSTIEEIKDGAFKGCSSLASIEWPSSIRNIGQEAFYGCSSLIKIEFPNVVINLGRTAFGGCTSLKDVVLNNTIVGGEMAFKGCESLESVVTSDNVTEIADSLFYDCSEMLRVVIGKSVTRIGVRAFYGCKNIDLTIEKGNVGDVVSCDSKAFVYTSGYTDYKRNEEINIKVLRLRRNCKNIIEPTLTPPANYSRIFLEKVIISGELTNAQELENIRIDSLIVEDADTELKMGENFRTEGTIYLYLGRDVDFKMLYLRKFIIGKKVNRIKASKYSTTTMSIECMRGVPPTIIDEFHRDQYLNSVVYVPKGSLNFYRTDEGWKKFKNIEETDVPADEKLIAVKCCSRKYGDPNPKFEFETNLNTLDGVPEIVCSAQQESPVGTYVIEIRKGSLKYDNVYLVNGTLTVEKAPLAVSAGHYTMIQGSAMPTFKATYTGFKNGETEVVLTKQPVFSTSATESSVPGDYPVMVSGAEARNYDIRYEQGTLTIISRAVYIPVITIKGNELSFSDESKSAKIYYTLDGTNPTTNSRLYENPISLSASCVIKAIAVFDGYITDVAEAEYHDASYPNIVKVGDVVTANIINNGEYNLPMVFKVTSVYPFEVSLENKEYYVEGWNNSNFEGSIEIPTTVTASGVTYDVKRLGRHAFTRASNIISLKLNEGLEYIDEALRELHITEITIPNTVKSIGSAFMTDCFNLQTVVLGSGLERIGSLQFWGVGSNSFKSIISMNPIPPIMDSPDDAFKDTYKDFPKGMTLYVPIGSKEAYETAPGWNRLVEHIVEINMADIKNSVIITARSYTRQYGDGNPTFGYDVLGATLDGVPEITCEAVNNSPVGTYAIVVKQGTVKNYNVVLTNGTLTVEKAPLTISAGTYTKKQGDAMPTFKAVYNGFKNGETYAVLTKQPVFSTAATEASAPGSYPVSVSGAEAQNYDISYEQGTLTVTQADAVIITARSYTRQYGDNNPTLEYDVQGATLDGVPEITCEAAKDAPVGTYAIVVKQGTVKNYNVVLTNGTLIVTKAPLTISAGTYTKKQGDAMPTFKATYTGFKNGETESVLTKQPVFSTAATEASAPGSYPVTVSGAEVQNYDISYRQGTLTVTQADAVVITARSYTRQYGDGNPTFEYDVQGATLDGVPEITCEAVNNSPVGTYAIVLKQGTVKNYNVVLTNGTLTVEKAPLTISAGTYTKKQGDAMPAFKATYAGFKNGETEAVLTKQPVFSTTANEASAPGNYPVTVSGAEAQNYDISYEQGTLTVTQADAVIITARSYTRQYGDNNPTFEYDVQGAVLDGVPEITCEAAKDAPVGTYAIVVKQGTVKNYNVVLNNGTLTIEKAPLTISAGTYTKKQGNAMPAFKATYAGFKNGETEAVLTKQPVFSTPANENSEPGEYPVYVSGAKAQNYELTYVSGVLFVEAKMPQSIVWNQEIIAKVGSTIEMEATATSGLPVRYSYYRPMAVINTYAIPEINGNKVTFPQTGDYLITAIQDGDDVYAMAADTIQVYVMDDDDPMYIDGIYYKYAYGSTSTLKVVKGHKPYVGKVEIPATANGMPVVEVDIRAFDGSYFLTEVVIGDNVVKCGGDCFGASINLRTVTLPRNSDVRFDYYQFNCDRSIKEIHCRSQIPYYADETTFNGSMDYTTCILYVPTGTKQAYREAQEWCKFVNIVEEDVPSGIGDVQFVGDSLSWYTLQGVKLPAKPSAAGIYIHGGKKVIVK